jgi:hypothetical protein
MMFTVWKYFCFVEVPHLNLLVCFYEIFPFVQTRGVYRGVVTVSYFLAYFVLLLVTQFLPWRCIKKQKIEALFPQS